MWLVVKFKCGLEFTVTPLHEREFSIDHRYEPVVAKKTPQHDWAIVKPKGECPICRQIVLVQATTNKDRVVHSAKKTTAIGNVAIPNDNISVATSVPSETVASYDSIVAA